jgi:hypothetical protein
MDEDMDNSELKSKTCSKCGIEKSISEFNKHKLTKDKLSSWCKKCNYEHTQAWVKANPDKSRAFNNKWKKNNPDKTKETLNAWKKVNKDKINEINKKYNKNKYNKDLNFRIRCVLRGRLNNSLKNNYKSARTEKLLGCTIPELKAHLEKQFLPEMSFDNYGEWHIDHIKPCALFDLSISEEQAKCFHYTNLQPLWAIDNLRKGSKLIEVKS